ncbi:hypothetical protein [Aerococcus christensenii]|uniref:Uncharacterized protein n=1 Tax=Aerococcus christensenii TaxID=87541 RepID=A0A133Y3U2_9LACT|nr:hypothetical protein [Aerococcus christensenii]KXB37869.1 hypothetical protein HMPREF3187_00263 [Aerococcus christensenii]MDK8233200.1 hypothetical protein [Aerococcus christensenii]
MRIQLRCDHHFTTFDLNLNEVKGWLNIDILPDESEEEVEKRAQEKVKRKSETKQKRYDQRNLRE